MPIKVKIDPNAPPMDLAKEQKQESVKITLKARKTLDGKIMILDHMHVDIIVDTANKKIIVFPKEDMSDEVYVIQNDYFKHLVNEGVLIPESIQGGNVFGSLEAQYPEASDENVNAAQVILLSTKKFIDQQNPRLEKQEFIEDEMEDELVDPTPEDSTELGEVPQEPKKGSITPYRIRRYLSGYGYY